MNMQSPITASPPLAEAAPRPARMMPRWVAIAVLAAAALLTRGIWFGNPVGDIDEQLYSFVGWRMQHGELPYIDWWDRKPFGLFAIFGLAHAIGGPGAVAYQVLAALSTLGGAVLVYHLARPLVDRMAAMFAGLLYVALISAYASYSGQSEAFHVPMVLAMTALVADPQHRHARRRALIAMAIGGLALQVKYTVVPQCVFLGCWALWGEWQRRGDWRSVASLAAAFAALGLAPTALVAAFYAAIGGWDAFLFANFVSFFDRAAADVGRFDPRHKFWLIPIFVLLVLGAYAAFRMVPPRNLRLYGFYVGCFIAALATVYLPSTVYQYYFAALVPTAILLALPILDGSGPWRLFPAILLTAGAFYLLNLPDRYRSSQTNIADIHALAEAIAPHVSSEECLYVYDGPTVLYRMTGSCVPTRYVYPDHLNNVLEKDALGVDQAGEVARILATRPAVIVTANKPMTAQNPQSTTLIKDAVARDYRRIAEASFHDRIQYVWVRRN